MPVVKRSAAKRETVVRAVEGPFADLTVAADVVDVASPAPSVERVAVTVTNGVLTVDLAALDALSQGDRQAALKSARTVLDRVSQ